MELYFIPFLKQFIIYRPLRQLAFIGNRAMVRYIQGLASGDGQVINKKVDGFLKAIDFDEPDPPPPEPWIPSEKHRPPMSVLLMTSACNLRCTYCYASGGDDEHLWMTIPLARSVICRETQCKITQVEPCYINERGKYQDPTSGHSNIFIRKFLEAFEIAISSGRALYYSGARPWLVTDLFCRAPEDALIVTPEGDVVTCFEIYDRRHPLISNFTIGHASPEGVEIDIEKLYTFANYRKQLNKRCKNCFCYWHCGGDCTTRCISSQLSPGSNCGRFRANRIITREILAWYITGGDGLWKGSV